MLFDPAFADLDVRIGNFLRFDINDEMVVGDVISNETALAIHRFEQNIDRP